MKLLTVGDFEITSSLKLYQPVMLTYHDSKCSQSLYRHLQKKKHVFCSCNLVFYYDVLAVCFTSQLHVVTLSIGSCACANTW